MSHTAPLNTYFYASRMGRIILQAMGDTLGKEQLADVLQRAGLEQYLVTRPSGSLDRKFPFEHVSALQQAVEEVYGMRAGHALNLRVGRNVFGSGLKEFDPVLGIADLPLRLMPLGMKFRVGLDVFARVFNQFTDQVVRLSEDDEHHLWVIERCPVCWGRHTDEPCCHLAVGLLDESIYWGTGGRRYNGRETLCVAKGDATCTIAIDKRPID
ncbi:MAG: 4-vinyl reductase [Chloroflexi bacterium]|nr:4-vinyl reductase [Chloroflexota bacterium]